MSAVWLWGLCPFWFCATAYGAEEGKCSFGVQRLTMRCLSPEPAAWQLIPSLVRWHSHVCPFIWGMGALCRGAAVPGSGVTREPWAQAYKLPVQHPGVVRRCERYTMCFMLHSPITGAQVVMLKRARESSSSLFACQEAGISKPGPGL